MLHVDIMDGHFVPNLTMGPPVVESIRKVTKAELDVHLMITDPDQYAPMFIEAGGGPCAGASGSLPASGPHAAHDPERGRAGRRGDQSRDAGVDCSTMCWTWRITCWS